MNIPLPENTTSKNEGIKVSVKQVTINASVPVIATTATHLRAVRANRAVTMSYTHCSPLYINRHFKNAYTKKEEQHENERP